MVWFGFTSHLFEPPWRSEQEVIFPLEHLDIYSFQSSRPVPVPVPVPVSVSGHVFLSFYFSFSFLYPLDWTGLLFHCLVKVCTKKEK